MNNFKNEFLRYSYLKNPEQGLTLVELLVVIFIIGILSAIALPSFLKQVNKAKGVEATVRIKNFITAERNYYLENSVFTDDASNLNYSLETENYRYLILLFDGRQIVIHVAIPKKPGLQYHGGGVYFRNGIDYPCGPLSTSNPTIPAIVALVRSSCQF
ncbi:type IV pilin protein [Argonema antarcticum]|uniref:type IV pilin protein n=1 Tax=Argonema antarcticum TaxID=2942763 RepID=UPI0023DF601A|nr:type IV pilin-like G/H family protein [Argonema antarcticum]